MTDTSPLFPDEPMTLANPTSQSGAKVLPPKAAARVLMPNRHQPEWRASDLDSHLLRLAPVKRQGGLKAAANYVLFGPIMANFFGSAHVVQKSSSLPPAQKLGC
jgi:hypothetical protein